MSINVLQGDPLEILFGSIALGSANGRTIALNNIVWQTFACATFNFQTTATAGNRQWIFQLFDAAANLVWEFTATTLATASSAIKASIGPQVFASSINGGNQYIPSLYPAFIPPGSSFKFFDANNIDPNDTVSATIMLTT